MPNLSEAAKVMDMIATNETVSFINDYFSENNPDGKRKKFPAVFSIYLSGLDHEAHGDEKSGGMGEYKSFFMDTTDSQIRYIAEALQQQDEFYNKIFVITADHGHTAMPTDLPPIPGDDGKLYDADISGKLKVKDFDKKDNKYPELANNNLHIWELGEVFKAAGEESGLSYKVLSPKPIAKLFKDKNQNGIPYGATSDISKANVIAALNGPMAHIYLKNGDNWKNIPNENELNYLAIVLKRMLQESGINLDDDVKNKFPRLLSSVDKILIRLNGVYKVFNGFDGTGNIIPSDDIATLPNSIYVNPVDRITRMNNINRSGDIILIFNNLTDDIAENRYSSGVSYKSWHGSLNRSDSYVPFIITYPGGNKFEIEPIINNTEGCSTENGCDGNWKLTDIVKGIITEQYE